MLILPLKRYRPTKKKNRHEIETTFNFKKENPQKITRNKKNSNLKLGLKNTPLGPLSLDPFLKQSYIVILKIVRQLSNLYKI